MLLDPNDLEVVCGTCREAAVRRNVMFRSGDGRGTRMFYYEEHVRCMASAAHRYRMLGINLFLEACEHISRDFDRMPDADKKLSYGRVTSLDAAPLPVDACAMFNLVQPVAFIRAWGREREIAYPLVAPVSRAGLTAVALLGMIKEVANPIVESWKQTGDF